MNPMTLLQPTKDDESQRYLALPRHRRRIILNLLKSLTFNDCLNAGSAQHYLLDEIKKNFNISAYGCDISKTIIYDNTIKMPNAEFRVLNIEHETWPNKTFDLVIYSEVIEHMIDWETAIKNLTEMSKRYLLMTVPSGKIRKTDRIVGHYRHYQGQELVTCIESHGFKCIQLKRRGFPMHSLYKIMINLLRPEKLYAAFHHEQKYTMLKKGFANIVYGLFFIDYFFSTGNQLYILAERQQRVELVF